MPYWSIQYVFYGVLVLGNILTCEILLIANILGNYWFTGPKCCELDSARLAVWARRPHDSTGFLHINSAGRLQRPNLRTPGMYYASVRSQQCGGGDVRRQFELMVVKSSFGAELPSYQKRLGSIDYSCRFVQPDQYVNILSIVTDQPRLVND